MLADEPTSNLDMTGIRCLEELLIGFDGGLLIVSHDRALLRNVCNKVLEKTAGNAGFTAAGIRTTLNRRSLKKRRTRSGMSSIPRSATA
jgi:macrolide transport system ATP-binding/permease protein